MIYIVLTSIFAVVVVSAILWLKSMTRLDQISVMFQVITRSGFHRFRTRVPEEVTLFNGFKTTIANPMIKEIMEEALRLKMRPDDVIVASYAKSGTTWLQELVWLICNDADVKTATAINLWNRYGFLEVVDGQWYGKGLQALKAWPTGERRFIKTHLPFEILPEELQNAPMAKTICVVRNPKDTCVSLYHFSRANTYARETRSWNEFLEAYCTNELEYGSWFDHVERYWQMEQKRKQTMYIVMYESLLKDTKGEVIKMAKFLEKDLSAEQVDAIVAHCSFKSMSKNDKTNYTDVKDKRYLNFKVSKFMRKGVIGDWKNHFTINQSRAFDELFKEKTKNWPLKFDFEPDN